MFCGPLIVLILLGWTLWLAEFLIKFSGVIIAVIEVDRSAVNVGYFSDSQVVCSQKFTILSDILFSLQKFTLRNARIFFLLLIDRDRIILKIKQDLDLSISLILTIGLNYAFLEISIKPQHMSIEVDIIRLVQLGTVF